MADTHSIVIDGEIITCDEEMLDWIKFGIEMHNNVFFGETKTIWHRGQPKDSWAIPHRKHG